ncbi:MAG: nucleotidyl transferase AbiEii/AbiGii toxin family protein [Candidatus Woesebacteria bacterium]|nr:nucleotidyl transferase AbiEii/AbiGii toxin family protein [Candidatus Woesebacteria bacterium]
MNNAVTNFDEILRQAHDYGLPQEKKRAILREYLQTKILSLIYQETVSKNLYFIGGTALRILRGLNRFSEDLDFDSVGTTPDQIRELIKTIVHRLDQENIAVELYQNTTPKKYYYELRFPRLLAELKLGSVTGEKLMIKLDIENFWRGQKREMLFVNRYGLLATVVTNPLDQILVEKLAAYLGRKETQARDLYDLVWLLAKGIKTDNKFALKNNLTADLLEKALKKFNQEKKNLPILKNKLKPFLFDEKKVSSVNFFENLVKNSGK